MTPVHELSTVIVCSKNENRLHMPLKITVRKKFVGTHALIDLGAKGLFIDRHFVMQNNLAEAMLPHPIIARNVDGTPNQGGVINSTVELTYKIGRRLRKDRFLVTNLGQTDLILGQP